MRQDERIDALVCIVEQLIELPIYIPEHIRSQIDEVMNYKKCGRCRKWKPLNAYDKRKTKPEHFTNCMDCTDKNRARLR